MREAKEIIARNLEDVRRRMADAAARRGRDPSAVTLVAVTKTVGANEVRALHALGQQEIGENRVQPALAKMEAVSDLPLRWHMIGHLQRNKVKKALPRFALIHSVDSLRLAHAITREAEELGRAAEVLLEVNVSGEESKFGLTPDEAVRLLEEIEGLEYVCVQGLMTMAPFVDDPETVRPIFAALRELRDRIVATRRDVELPHLSMGMTQDYEVAIEEGATIVRVGTALFRGLNAHRGAGGENG